MPRKNDWFAFEKFEIIFFKFLLEEMEISIILL